MPPRRLCLLAALLFAAPALAYSPAPTSYTVTMVNALFGPPMTMTIYRDGDAVVFDHGDSHARGYNDLAKHRSYSWSVTEAHPLCGTGTFWGDWGDPFATDMLSDLAKSPPKQIGTEVVNGVRTKILEAPNPQAGGKPYRLWIDQTYGELVKLVGPSGNGAVGTLIEIKSLTLGKPPASVFTLTPECAKIAATDGPAPAPKPEPTEAEAIAAATGRDPAKYVRGTFGPGTNETCSVLVSVVQRGTLVPIRVPFHMAIDPKVDVDHPAQYSMGGTPLFKGGGLQEVTSRFHNGVARVDGLSPAFDVEILYGSADGKVAFDGHAHSARIYKRCFGRRVEKFYVVVDAGDLSKLAEWLWEK